MESDPSKSRHHVDYIDHFRLFGRWDVLGAGIAPYPLWRLSEPSLSTSEALGVMAWEGGCFDAPKPRPSLRLAFALSGDRQGWSWSH